MELSRMDDGFREMVLEDGIEEFQREVRVFADQGLSRLADDLANGMVPLRGTWRTCPLSYRLGRPGSCHASSDGKSGTHFTVAWDEEAIDADILKQLVQDEMDRRARERA